MGVSMSGGSPCIQEREKKVMKTYAHSYSCTLWYRTVTSRPEILITPSPPFPLHRVHSPVQADFTINSVQPSLCRAAAFARSFSPHTQIYIRTRILLLLLLLLYVYTEEAVEATAAAVVAMTFFSAAPLRRPRRRFNSVPRCAHLWAPRVRL